MTLKPFFIFILFLFPKVGSIVVIYFPFLAIKSKFVLPCQLFLFSSKSFFFFFLFFLAHENCSMHIYISPHAYVSTHKSFIKHIPLRNTMCWRKKMSNQRRIEHVPLFVYYILHSSCVQLQFLVGNDRTTSLVDTVRYQNLNYSRCRLIGSIWARP